MSRIVVTVAIEGFNDTDGHGVVVEEAGAGTIYELADTTALKAVEKAVMDWTAKR